MIAPACWRAHSSVCSTSARAEFVSSVAWWRACSSRRLAARLGLAHLGRRVAVRVREQLARLVLGRVQDLGPLALALVAVALDLGLVRLQLALRAPDLLLGPAHLRGRGGLRVALERVGELGGGADQVQRVHPDGVTGRLDVGGLARRLEHAQLRLELQRVAAERVEGLADAVGVEPAALDRRECPRAAATTSAPARAARDLVPELTCGLPRCRVGDGRTRTSMPSLSAEGQPSLNPGFPRP